MPLSPSGQWFNSSTHAPEVYNAANWTSYAAALREPVVNSGIYFGDVPTGLAAGLMLLSVYVRTGASAATTDLQLANGGTPVTLVLDWSGCAAKSIAPLGSSVDARPASIPAPQTSLQYAQQALNTWLQAGASLASQGFASITVDGNQVVYRNPKDVSDQIEYWKKQVALLSGTRRRAVSFRLDHAF